MRLEPHITKAQLFLDNLGHCRFSAFYNHHDNQRKMLVEMVGSLAVGIFAALSLYDFATKSLPFPVRLLVHGTLIAILTSLGLSWTIKKLMPAPDRKPQPALPKAKEPNKIVPPPGPDKVEKKDAVKPVVQSQKYDKKDETPDRYEKKIKHNPNSKAKRKLDFNEMPNE